MRRDQSSRTPGGAWAAVVLSCAFVVACALACVGGGSGGAPLPLTGGAAAVPIRPTLQSPIAADAQVTLSWPSVSGATSYNLYYGTSPGVTRITGTPQIAITSPYTRTGLTNGTTYYFVLTAANAAGESVLSAEVSATPQAAGTPPAAPTLATPTAGDSQVTLTWSPVSGATSYNLYYASSAGVTTSSSSHLGITSPHAHTGLTNGTPYYFALTAVNSAGASALSNEVSATPQAAVSPPAAPVLAAPTAGDGQVTLTWAAVSGATSYSLYYGTSPGVTPANGKPRLGVSSPLVQSGLTNGTTYYFVLTAVNAAGASAVSNEVSATPQAATGAPAAPVLNGPTAGDAQVTLTWAAVTGAISYNLYYATSANVTTATGTKITGVTSPYTHTGLTNGTPYYYVLTAVNAAGESPISNEVSATPQAAVTVPGAPTLSTATAGNSQVTLTWAPVTGAVSYNVYYGTAPGVTTSTGTQVAGVTSPHAQTGLTNGIPYYFVVTAVNSAGESVISNELSATPQAPPASV